MTTATYAPSDAGLAARRAERTGSTILAALAQAFSDYFGYRRALAELRTLDVRQLDDLGLAGRDLRVVALEAVYGR